MCLFNAPKSVTSLTDPSFLVIKNPGLTIIRGWKSGAGKSGAGKSGAGKSGADKSGAGKSGANYILVRDDRCNHAT